jgi:glycosyltransferase involved in cell wall biosynthesis
VHAHFIYPDGVAASRIADELGVPFVVTEHAPWDPLLTNVALRHQAVGAARSAGKLTAVSEYVRETMRRFLCNDQEIHLVPNGVDGQLFRLPDESERRNRHQILYVGQINFNKGIDVLLAAAPAVTAACPDARFVLVGGSYYRRGAREASQLRDLAARLALGDRLVFAGQLAQREVAALMRQSGVLVLPSHHETFGAPLIEALASGTPVVATRSGGPDGIVTRDVGRLVPPGDAEALGGAIRDVLLQQPLFDEQQLRAFALKQFDWSVIAPRYLDLYAAAIDGHIRSDANAAACPLEGSRSN